MMNEVDQFKDELFRERERFGKLIDEQKLLVLVVNREYLITYVSEYVSNILGHTAEHMLNKKLDSFIAEDAAFLLPQITEGLAGIPGGSRLVHNLVIKGANEKLHYFDGTVTDMRKDLSVSGYVLYLCDVTRRREVENELLRTNFELDNLFYRTSH